MTRLKAVKATWQTAGKRMKTTGENIKKRERRTSSLKHKEKSTIHVKRGSIINVGVVKNCSNFF